MKNTYFAEKFLHSFALLICSMVLCTTYSTAQVFRKYIPPTDEANQGRCIVNINTANDYLVVGDYSYPTNVSAHALWVQDDGVLLDQRNYNNGFDALDDKYNFKMIARSTVQGSYVTTFPYQPRYQGYPVVGTRLKSDGFPATLKNLTYVAILDPVNKNIVWSHTIDDAGFQSKGIAVIVDDLSQNTFYVLSELVTDVFSQTLQRFAVTKFTWTPGNAGHQVVWTKEYNEGGDNNFYIPTGMTQRNNDIVIIGNRKNRSQHRIDTLIDIDTIVIDNEIIITRDTTYHGYNTPVRSRIFSIPINRNTGVQGTIKHYFPQQAGSIDIAANSIEYDAATARYIVAGWAEVSGIRNPYLLKLNSTLDFAGSVRYDINGEFAYAKLTRHPIGTPTGAPENTITAVGKNFNYAYMINVRESMLTTINWAARYTYNLSEATWFAEDRGTDGNFVCSGIEYDMGSKYALTGVIRKYDGYNECSSSTLPMGTDLELFISDEEFYSEDWFVTEPLSIDEVTPELSPYYCTGGNEIYYGKKSEEEKQTMTMTGLPSFTARYADNSIHVQYALSQASTVEIILTDILGNIIAQETLYEQSGVHHVNYEAHHLSSGAYILNIRINTTHFSQPLSIIK